MKEVTEIKKIGKGERYYVYLDNELFGVFEDEILAKHKLKSGESYDEDFLNNLLIENGNLACFNRGLSVIEKSVKSKKMLKDYLKSKKYPKQCIDNALEKLESYGYIDDESFCENYISSYGSSKSQRKLKYDLLSKGINENIIDNKLQELLKEDDEDEKCFSYAEKYMKNKEIDIKTKQKLYNHLLGKGFDYGTISKAWEKIENDRD